MVVRGGSFMTIVECGETTYRDNPQPPSEVTSDLGFRIIIECPERSPRRTLSDEEGRPVRQGTRHVNRSIMIVTWRASSSSSAPWRASPGRPPWTRRAKARSLGGDHRDRSLQRPGDPPLSRVDPRRQRPGPLVHRDGAVGQSPRPVDERERGLAAWTAARIRSALHPSRENLDWAMRQWLGHRAPARATSRWSTSPADRPPWTIASGCCRSMPGPTTWRRRVGHRRMRSTTSR